MSVAADIEKKFGKGAFMRMGDKPIEDIPVISTGSLNLDIALGVGGLPRGRIIEIMGEESSGKTSLCLTCAAEAQKAGGKVAFIDAEHALDPDYAEVLGVDVENLWLSQPDNGEQALGIAQMVIESGDYALVVIDSVSALTPKAELAGEIGDSHVGLQARLMSQSMRILVGAASRTNTTVIFINQYRMKIGVTFGDPRTTSGGKALPFAASVRIDVAQSTKIKRGEEVVGALTRFRVKKNKVAPPFKIAETDMYFGKGYSKASELLDLGVSMVGKVDEETGEIPEPILVKKGSHYYYNEAKIGQGKDNCVGILEETPELMDEIEAKVRERAGL